MTSIDQSFIEGLVIGARALGVAVPFAAVALCIVIYREAQEARAALRAAREQADQQTRELTDIEYALDSCNIPRKEEGRLVMSIARRVRVALEPGAKTRGLSQWPAI